MSFLLTGNRGEQTGGGLAAGGGPRRHLRSRRQPGRGAKRRGEREGLIPLLTLGCGGARREIDEAGVERRQRLWAAALRSSEWKRRCAARWRAKGWPFYRPEARRQGRGKLGVPIMERCSLPVVRRSSSNAAAALL
jgi:hypothetical protein